MKLCPNCEKIGYLAYMKLDVESMLHRCTNCFLEEPYDYPGTELGMKPLNIICHHFDMLRRDGLWECIHCTERRTDSAWVVYFSTLADQQAETIEKLQEKDKEHRFNRKVVEYLEESMKKFPLMSAGTALMMAKEYASQETET